MNQAERRNLAATYAEGAGLWSPPEDLTVDEWADKYRRLPKGMSAEAGLWRTSRAPYMREPMRAFTDPRVEEITVVAGSQVGKSELELNIILYIIDQDPGTILYIQPRKEDARSFSNLRVAPAIRDCEKVAGRVRDAKRRGEKASATILQKAFPGGMLTLVGSHSASDLSSQPVRYVLGDELDRWAESAGRDGNPWELAVNRQTTFYNRKRVAVSTPTVKNASQIEYLYRNGTQERWKTECPHCREFHEIRFRDIKFSAERYKVAGKYAFRVHMEGWKCPGCGWITPEHEAKKAPAKWIPEHPEALESNRSRSFWLTGFASPWRSWETVVKKFYKAQNDPEKLKVWKNTDCGELWELRDVSMDEETLIKRAEEYPEAADLPGNPGEGPLVLTCGVDCQRSYLQYEIVGWGRYGESWGIRTGVIPGEPNSKEAWEKLDSIVSRGYRFANGRGLRVAMTCVDSGDGVYTNDIALRCKQREGMCVFAVKGSGVQGKSFISPPTKQPIDKDKRRTYYLYSIGVSAGKSVIMKSVQAQEPGPGYMHFPSDESRGYDLNFYSQLLSEHEVAEGNSAKWVKLPGKERNEALDIRNYAMAAVRIINPDFDACERALRAEPREKKSANKEKKPRKRSSLRDQMGD